MKGIKIILKMKRKYWNNMFICDIKIFLKMKNKGLLSIEKNIMQKKKASQIKTGGYF